MGQIRLEGNPEISVALRRSARARRIALRVSRLDGRVTLTLPAGLADAEARRFLAEHESWVLAQLARQNPMVEVTFGAVLPVEGVARRVVPAEGKTVTLTADHLCLPSGRRAPGAAAQAFLRARARDRLAAASDRYAARLGRPYTALALRDTRSRWGSCSSAGRLMYSWRLILAPPAVLDYVAAHEVAHLKEMNHGPRFWRTVTDLHGDWQAQRRWLHTHGADLHRYRFTD